MNSSVQQRYLTNPTEILKLRAIKFTCALLPLSFVSENWDWARLYIKASKVAQILFVSCKPRFVKDINRLLKKIAPTFTSLTVIIFHLFDF